MTPYKFSISEKTKRRRIFERREREREREREENVNPGLLKTFTTRFLLRFLPEQEIRNTQKRKGYLSVV